MHRFEYVSMASDSHLPMSFTLSFCVPPTRAPMVPCTPRAPARVFLSVCGTQLLVKEKVLFYAPNKSLLSKSTPAASSSDETAMGVDSSSSLLFYLPQYRHCPHHPGRTIQSFHCSA